MNQRDIELLLSLEQTKNITATSENFFITQSALSKRLNALEAELQVQIVLRSRHGVQFTPAGEIVLKRIHQIHQQFGLMQSELTEITHEVTGSLKIGVSYNFARYQFSQVLAGFKKKYPKVAISVQTANSPRFADDLHSEKLDLVISRGRYSGNKNRTLLMTEPVYLACRQETTLTDLPAQPYIVHHTDKLLESEQDRWLSEHHLLSKIHTDLTIDNIITVADLVEAGIGWSILPEICLNNFSGYKTPLTFKDGTKFERSTFISENQESSQLVQVKAFKDYVVNYFTNQSKLL